MARLAKQGSADAQFLMGEIYRMGLGVKKDRNQALMWYRKAAESGVEGAERRIVYLVELRKQLLFFGALAVPSVVVGSIIIGFVVWYGALAMFSMLMSGSH